MTKIDLLEPTLSQRANNESGRDERRQLRGRAWLLKVLHVINGEHYAGAERVQDLLAQRLPDFGYETAFACVKAGRFSELRQAQATPLHEFSMRSRCDVRAVWNISRLIRREGFDLVHAHTPRSLLVARPAALLAGVPLVYHVHSPTARDTTHPWRNCVNGVFERAGLWRVPRLICVSHSLGRHMQAAGYSADKIAVVPNGVPIIQAKSIRSRPADLWTLGVVALFRPRKGLEVLLEALSLLRGQQLPIKLRAIGTFETPEYEAQIKSQVARLGLDAYIEWTGFTRDVNSELARLDLFVLPSLFGEGLPMVVLEAMAAGVPVVATGVEGVPEAIRDGLDGLIALPNDPADLAAKISQVVRGEADWSALRDSARERQAEQFSDLSMAAGVAREYDEVLRC